MDDISKALEPLVSKHNVTDFDPKKTVAKQAKTTAVAAVARRVSDWPTLEKAIEVKIEDQREFVRWWREKVKDGRPEKSRTSALLSQEDAEDETGIKHQTVSRWDKGLEDEGSYRKRLYGRSYAAAMQLDRGAAKKLAKEVKARELPPGECTLICGDIADIKIEPASVDLILTDPPYPQKYLPVYETLAKRASEWLKPGGSLLCMCGQSYLPDILALMTTHIRYHWMLSYLTPGGQSAQLWDRRVNTFWKPILWFVNGDYRGEWVGDVARSDINDNDKRFHHWGQSESGIAAILDKFYEPGQLVCDPFLGGGTTAIVALDMGFRFIGADVDQKMIDNLRVSNA